MKNLLSSLVAGVKTRIQGLLTMLNTQIMGIINYAMSYIPTALPIGMSDFDNWAQTVLGLSSVPDNDSTRFALAVQILHLDQTSDKKPMRYFVKALHKGAANQVVSQVMQDLKAKQDLNAKQAMQGSTPAVSTTNVQPIQNA